MHHAIDNQVKPRVVQAEIPFDNQPVAQIGQPVVVRPVVGVAVEAVANRQVADLLPRLVDHRKRTNRPFGKRIQQVNVIADVGV